MSRLLFRPFRQGLVTALTLSALLATAGVASADPSLSDRETARSLMDDGDAKRDKGDFKSALKSYEAADAIMHVPTTGLEVARAQAQLGLLLEARESLGRVMRLPPKASEPPAFTNARRTAESLSAELGARIPTVTVVAQNVEPGQSASIVFDGEVVPSAAAQAPRKVNPGHHTVIARAGTNERKLEIDVAERESKTVTLDLKPVAISEFTKVDDTPPPANGPSAMPKVLMYGGFGIGAVGIGVGAVTGILSISKVSSVKKDCTNNICPANRQSAIDSAKSLGTISTIAFIVGGVGVAAGVIGVVLSGKQSSTEPPAASASAFTIRADVGPTWAGVHGAF